MITNSEVKIEYDAVVVGSGPNGLACAIELARNKLSVLLIEKTESIGGGLKTMELTGPGYHHDVCSSVYPMAAASPFLKSLPLEQFGLKWIFSEAELAHPFADGTVALLRRSVSETAAQFPNDVRRYHHLFDPLVKNFSALMDDILAPPLHIPKDPISFGLFGLKSLRSAHNFAQHFFKDERARALFMGSCAHSSASLTGPATAAVGLTLQLVGHGAGWPIPKGGAAALAKALADYFQTLGGQIVVNTEIRSAEDLPKSKLVFFDLSPWQIMKIAPEKLKRAVTTGFKNYQHGPAVFKLDWALDSPVPWLNPGTAKSITVHLGNTHEEITESEHAVSENKISEKPFVLFAQPSLFDDSRTPPGKHLAWAYCHLPRGSSLDRTDAIENQVERMAPGFKKTIIKRSKLFPKDLQAHNANLIDGDISGGLVDAKQLFFRPRIALNPYVLDEHEKYWICSASTPPGPGVHGMSGYRAAKIALKTWVK